MICRPSGEISGSATAAFPGNSGNYDVVVVYHDENDGVAQLTVTIAGVSIDSWILDQTIPGGAQPQDYNRFSRQITTDLTVNNGDTIRIDRSACTGTGSSPTTPAASFAAACSSPRQ